MRRYVAEFVGTFAIVFCGTGAVVIDQVTNGSVTHVGIAATFGLVVLAMIYTFGEISGAHFNPAVTLSFALSKQFPRNEILPYISSQVLGALLASIILRLLFPDSITLGATSPGGSDFQSFVLEAILTFLLMTVIFNVSNGSKEIGVLAGIAVGSTVLLEALFAGAISGASMNPARSIAPALVTGNIGAVWIYILAPSIGAICATYCWMFLWRTRNEPK